MIVLKSRKVDISCTNKLAARMPKNQIYYNHFLKPYIFKLWKLYRKLNFPKIFLFIPGSRLLKYMRVMQSKFTNYKTKKIHFREEGGMRWSWIRLCFHITFKRDNYDASGSRHEAMNCLNALFFFSTNILSSLYMLLNGSIDRFSKMSLNRTRAI